MFLKLRHNIYFFLVLLTAVFFLWLVNFFGNQEIRRQQHIHARIIKLRSQFSQSILKEQQTLDNPSTFRAMLQEQEKFFKQCTACHPSKTGLPPQRLNILKRKHDDLGAVSVLHMETWHKLKSLIESVNYIHEHHIVTLQNYLEYIRSDKELKDTDIQRRAYADEAVVEPVIIRQAVEIQHQMANIYHDFNMLRSNDTPTDILVTFRKHISGFYGAVNSFEENTFDAQDGLLVEELLESGRDLEQNFLQLIDLENRSRVLSVRLAENRNSLDAVMVRLESVLQQQQDKMMEQMAIINWGILLLTACLILAFLIRARSFVKAVDTLVDETRKISNDISYQIPKQSTRLAEFSVLRTALNTMAGELNRKVQALTEEIQTRRRMEVLLSQGKKEWERTFNAVPDMIFILDPDATILRANRAMLELLEMSFEEIQGRKCYEVVHRRSTFPDYCNFYAHTDDEPGADIPHYQQHEFYEEHFKRYFTAIMSPLYSSDGELTGYVHLMRDVTDQKKAEQEKENYALYLDSILSSSAHTAIVATDPNLRIKYFNPEAERIFQSRAAEVLGLSIHQVHNKVMEKSAGRQDKGRNVPRAVGHTLQTLRPGDVHNLNFTYGEVVIDARLSVITSSDGESSGYLLMANDITDRVAAKKQQQVMAERLLKAEKMEAIGLMAGGVAHDLNNILSGIINYPELMLLQMQGENRWKKSLEAIRDSGLRAAAIVADLLTIARGVACEKEIFSINDLIGQYLTSPEFEELSSRYPGIEVQTRLKSDLHTCRCSAVHMQKILMNLVANGFEAIGEQGTVTIATTNEELTGGRAEEYKLAPGKYVCMVITDTGKGITDEDALHMFEPFYSKKKMGHSGTGLGLAVVWNTVQDHKGAITVSRVEQGTAFTVLMPAAEAASAAEMSSAADGVPLHGSGTVLVVDDEPLQRDVACRMLETLGYTTVTASNGREAVQQVEQQDFDLIILDMIMEPDMNGRQTLEKILQIRPEQKTLIASGYAESSEVRKACLMGNTSLMNKPYSLEKLAESVRLAMTS